MNTDLTIQWDAATNAGDVSPKTLQHLARLARDAMAHETRDLWEAMDGFGPCIVNREPEMPSSCVEACALLAWDAAQNITLESAIGLNVILSRLAWLTPEDVTPVFDLMSKAWAAGAAGAPLPDYENTSDAPTPPRSLPQELSDRIWDFVDNAGEFDGDPGGFTAAIASLGTSYHEDIYPALERELSTRSDIASFTNIDIPDIQIDDLKNKPPKSFGDVFFRLITENNFDVEVLPSEEMSLEDNPHPTLAFTTKRILQTHDVYHIIADYPITPLGEVAISGFQLAQLGQNYSASFFAVTSRITLLRNPTVFGTFVQLALEGWNHGRQTPNLLGINWHRHWDKTVSQVRSELGIRSFKSVIPISDKDLRPEIF